MRVICGCGAVIHRLDDGTNREMAGECEQCLSGDYTKSSAWVESDRDVSQLDKLGKYKPAEQEPPDHKPFKKRK